MELHISVDRLLKISGKNRSQAARAADVTPTTIGNFLEGKSDIGVKKITPVLEDLGVDINSVILARLQELSGVRKPDNDALMDDFVYLFEKVDDINKKIIITTLVKGLSKNRSFEVQNALKRLKSNSRNL